MCCRRWWLYMHAHKASMRWQSSMSSAWRKPVSEIKQILKVHNMNKNEFINQYIVFMRYCWNEVQDLPAKMPYDNFLPDQIQIFLSEESEHLDELYYDHLTSTDKNVFLPVSQDNYDNEYRRVKNWAGNLIKQLRRDQPWTTIKKTPKIDKLGFFGASPNSETIPKLRTQHQTVKLPAEGYTSTAASTKARTKKSTATATLNIRGLQPLARPTTKTWNEINDHKSKEAEKFDREFMEFAKAKNFGETMITDWLGTQSVASKNINNMYEMFDQFQDDLYSQTVLTYDFDAEFTKAMEPLGFSDDQISSFLALQDKADKTESNMHIMQNAFLHTLGSNERVGSMNTSYHGPHAPAYAAPACHALTYAAPVAYAGPHAMTYAAMAYDPAHAMTYAAPVQYGDAHGLTCAAPGPFNRLNSQEKNRRNAARNKKKNRLEVIMPHSQKFEAFKKKFVVETFPQTLTPLLKEMISMCIDSYFEILNFDGDSAFAFTNNFEWFREISEHDMRAIVYQLFDTGHSQQSIQQVVDCIKEIQLHPNILENYVPEDPRPLWVRFPDQHRPPFGRRAKIIHS